MPWLPARGTRWGIRTRLLVPFAVVVLVIFGGALGLEEFADQRQAALLVNRRGDSVLQGITRRLQERERAKTVFAQLLAEDERVGYFTEHGDAIGLAQVLVPLRAKLELQHIDVYAGDGQHLLNLGPEDAHVGSDLIVESAAGVTRSSVGVGTTGLIVSAAAPVKSPAGVVGALAVGAVLSPDALSEIRGRDAVEVAIFRNGALVSTTVADPDLVRILGDAGLVSRDLGTLAQRLQGFHFQGVAQPVAADGLLLALVPTEDLTGAADERNVIWVSGVAVLAAVLLLLGGLLVRDVAIPLQTMVMATKEIIRGNYRQRLRRSPVREMDDLSSAINHLAGEVETQVGLLNHHAFYDPLTDLPNRALLIDRLHHALARHARHSGTLALLFLDVDEFKAVNDTLGHEVGDKILVAVGHILQACVRTADTVARFGGDEFVIMLEQIASLREATASADRIVAQMHEPLVLDGREIHLTVSIGIMVWDGGSTTGEDLLRKADLAMYEAKRKGRACYEVFDPRMDTRTAHLHRSQPRASAGGATRGRAGRARPGKPSGNDKRAPELAPPAAAGVGALV